MLKSVKVRLKPTAEQEAKLWKSADVARFAYNWAIARAIENSKSGNKFLDDKTLRKEFTQLKHTAEYAWLYETSNNVTKQAIKDACGAFKHFFQGSAGFPKFKSKKRTKPSFYNDNIKLKFKNERFLLEKVGWIKISEPQRITIDKFHNPRISFDGKYWYIGIVVDIPKPDIFPNGEPVNIHQDEKSLTVHSGKTTFDVLTTTGNTAKQMKKLRRLQRKVSRKYMKNKKGKEYVKTSNIIKLEKKIRLIYRKMANTKTNHIHQITAAIVKTKPKRVVIDNVSFSGVKVQDISKAKDKHGFNKFKRILSYKCSFYGIEFIEKENFNIGLNTAIA